MIVLPALKGSATCSASNAAEVLLDNPDRDLFRAIDASNGVAFAAGCSGALVRVSAKSA